jgi:adenylyltransferase/sulfurtransferase
VDFDTVELSNLQRQVLYTTSDVGRSKLAAARERLSAMNPHVRVEAHEVRLAPENAREILSGYDVVVDGTDNFATRYLVNDACVLLDKPNVHGSVFRFEGQVSVFWGGRGPCYRCLFPEPPRAGTVPSCAEGGVLGILPGIVGALQATEALKLILGRGEPLVGRLLLVDALEMRFRELRLARAPDCPACGAGAPPLELSAEPPTCPSQVVASRSGEIEVEELKRRLDRGAAPLLLDVRTPEEWSICRLPGAALVPLGDLEQRLGELDPERDLVVYCHVGGRSALAVARLRASGFPRATNLVGGIDAWAARIDRSMPRY